MTALLAVSVFVAGAATGAVAVAVPYAAALRRAKARAANTRHRTTIAVMAEIVRCDKANWSALSPARRN